MEVDENLEKCEATTEEGKENVNVLNEGSEEFEKTKEISKKKAKKLKLPRALPEVEIEVENSVEVKEEVENGENIGTEGPDIPAEVDLDENLSKKEKKERKKKRKYEQQLKDICLEGLKVDEEEIPEEPTVEEKKEKSKKSKRKNRDDVDDQPSIKKSKDHSGCLNNEEPILEETSKGRTFKWNENIKSILKKATNQEISKKKLCKRIINEYQTSYPDRKTYEELSGKFEKKLHGCSFVKIVKDKIILKEGEDGDEETV